MKKKLKINKLREKAWRVFSEWKRRERADSDGNVVCITCGTRRHWTTVHSGHFLHGHVKPTFLEETNVHVQCPGCNLYRSGNLIAYYDFMREQYGQDEIDRLKSLSHKVFKPSRDYYQGIIDKYQGLLDAMGKI